MRGGTTIDLDSVTGMLYRRPTTFRFPDGLSDSDRQFLAAEARAGFGGVLSASRCQWVNHPARVADAEFKPAQLRTAADCGLSVPRTLITNDPAEVTRFSADAGGSMVYKTLTSMGLDRDGQPAAVYTSIVGSADTRDPSIGLTAHTFQEWVEKKTEARVTVVGDQCFAVAIHAGSPASSIDWRADYDAVSYTVIDLPPDLVTKLRRYLDRFGLVYGAFDLIESPDGAWYFLECNPNGQWGWIAEETGLPIADAFARALLREGVRDG